MAEDYETSGYGKRPMWQWVVLYLIVAVVLYGAFYYFYLSKNAGYNSSNIKTTTTTIVTPTSTSTSTTTNQAEVQKFTVEGNEFAFSPPTITVKNGQPVEITFKNAGKFPHNFTILALNVATNTIQAGEQAVVTFTPDKKGKFQFQCTVPGHADKGMKGTLTVL